MDLYHFPLVGAAKERVINNCSIIYGEFIWSIGLGILIPVSPICRMYDIKSCFCVSSRPM